ncbi:hypothetical protein NQ317_010513 [Molorchus minor]|uniref:Uncharacterized protein n=1 Tax=Molorchus minor TaxID=1323400 RepID=A0ABQ9JQU8_9CUCU|nr:hypothetical protein NQ317_010513 [Molorchus minor]
MRNWKYLLHDEFWLKYDNPKENICSCSLNNYLILNTNKKAKKNEDNITNLDICLDLDNIVSQKSTNNSTLKNLSNVKQQYHTLVKSISQTPSENTQNIFKSNSMQFLSPKKVANGINKFNSLITRNQIRRTEKTAKNGAQIKSKTENDDERNQIRKSKTGFVEW